MRFTLTTVPTVSSRAQPGDLSGDASEEGRLCALSEGTEALSREDIE